MQPKKGILCHVSGLPQDEIEDASVSPPVRDDLTANRSDSGTVAELIRKFAAPLDYSFV